MTSGIGGRGGVSGISSADMKRESESEREEGIVEGRADDGGNDGDVAGTGEEEEEEEYGRAKDDFLRRDCLRAFSVPKRGAEEEEGSDDRILEVRRTSSSESCCEPISRGCREYASSQLASHCALNCLQPPPELSSCRFAEMDLLS